MEPVGSTYRQSLPTTFTVGGGGGELRRANHGSDGSITADSRPDDPASVTAAEQEGFQPKEPSAAEFKPYRPTGTPDSTQAGGGEQPQNGTAPVEASPQELTPQAQAQIAQLKAIEEKVKAHEAAHKAVGGAMTGPVSYSYTRGPDGKNYITGGEVPISISSGKTPQETISRMQQVIQAALAPADPSPQDRAVAGQAAAQQQEARQQLAAMPTTSETQPAASVEPEKLPDSIAARDLQRAYGNPAVSGKQQENAVAPDTAKSEIRTSASSFPGSGRTAPSTMTATGVTGFSQSQQMSYYA